MSFLFSILLPFSSVFSSFGGAWEGSGLAKDSVGWESKCQVLSYDLSSGNENGKETFHIDDGAFLCGGLEVRSYAYTFEVRNKELLRDGIKVGELNDTGLVLSLTEDELVKEIKLNLTSSNDLHLDETWFINGKQKFKFTGTLTKLNKRETFSDKEECGLMGDVNARIADCQTERLSNSGILWKLVTRLKAGEETWQDSETGYIWSDTIKGRTLGQAISICRDDESSNQRGHFGKLEWHLPTDRNYKIAESHGIREIVKHNEGLFWMVYAGFGAENPVWVYNGSNGKWSSAFPISEQNTRCIRYK